MLTRLLLLVLFGLGAIRVLSYNRSSYTAPLPSRPQMPILQPDEDPAARAALIVLRAMVPDEEPHPAPDRVRLRPDPAVLTDREAAARLSAMPKPVICETVDTREALELNCTPVTADRQRLAHGRLMEVTTGLLYSEAEWEKMRATGNERVLLVGREESLVLDRRDFERFWLDFLTLEYFSWIGRTPEYFGDYSGVTAIARHFTTFGGHGPVDDIKVISRG